MLQSSYPAAQTPTCTPAWAYPFQGQDFAFVFVESHEAPVGLVLLAAEQISAVDAEVLTLTLAVAQEPLSTQLISVRKVSVGFSLVILIVAFHSTTQYGKEINISHSTQIRSIFSFLPNH